MSPLPLLPAAPASSPASSLSSPDLREVPAKATRSSSGREESGSSFKDVLARSSPEEEPRDPSEPQEEAVADAGLVCPLPVQQPVGNLLLGEAGLSFVNPSTDPVLVEASVPAADGFGASILGNPGDEGVSVGSPARLGAPIQPTPDQPLPISKPLAQAAFQTPASFPSQPLPSSLLTAAESAGQAPEGLKGQNLVQTNAAGLEFQGTGSSFDPAKAAVAGLLAESEPSTEQITVSILAQSGEGAAENAGAGALELPQPPVHMADGGAAGPKRPISTGRPPTGTDGADAEPAMSAVLLQPSRTANSQKNPREAVAVFGGAVLEEAGAVFEPVELGVAADPDSGSGARFSGVPVQPQSVQIPTGSSHAVPVQADAARVLEHLETTLAKYRPNVPPHLEVNVDLQGGDTLQVRLDLRGDALLSTFRTDSPELRLALQRAWPDFVERSQQNGLNLAPASFDSPGMSSDSGAGSQADGRRQGFQESEGPLPEAFRKAPNQFARKGGEPSQRTSEPARTRWA
jgi:hypothetical protein